jgi:cobalt-zinc-cadmium efflux system outer membrane protein
MSPRRLLALCGLVILGGCLYHAQERADLAVCDLAARPYDLAPPAEATPAKASSGKDSAEARAIQQLAGVDVQTTALLQPPDVVRRQEIQSRLRIPPDLPGSEAPKIQVPANPGEKEREIRRLFPELPPLPEEPPALPGPNGQPYTLAELQRLAAENSPLLRQAAADVEAARGNLIQARAYPNPTVAYVASPSNDGSTPGVQGLLFDQTVKTFGKLKLQTAAAEMDLANAELALKRARSDLATSVRNAYFAVLVAKETVRVTRALARFTDAAYAIQTDLAAPGFAASYEPAALRAQAYTARLAYKQAIQGYIYAWKQLATVIGLRQLPLSAVAGRVDQAIPYFDYDAVLKHALLNHTDVLTARNVVDKARYNLKFAQITPYPDVNFQVTIQKEFALPPFQWVPGAQVSVALPIWDQNQGNIMATEAALMRAEEEPHRVEMNLTSTLATAYQTYKSSLDALEYYRRYILPDQVRTYRGVFERRGIDPNVAFADLVSAQQTLAQYVTSYLTVLGQLWTSVVSVADLLQTDDLFQLAHSLVVPELPELESLPAWPCAHPCTAGPAHLATQSEPGDVRGRETH